MITPPPGWTQHFGAHLFSLYPPDGGGRIRYYERITPLGRLSAVVRYILDQDPAYKLEDIGVPQRLTTDEGEYAAWVPTRGSRNGGPARHFIGVVFTDEFAAAIDALAVVRSQFAELERTCLMLLQSVSLGLKLRRRRFFYTPPSDWQSLPSGLVANWYPPDFPANMATISVFPANPVEGPPPTLFKELLDSEQRAGLLVEETSDAAPFSSTFGLSGSYWKVRGQRRQQKVVFCDVVILSEGTFRYILRLDSLLPERLQEHRIIFQELASSAQPVPRAIRQQPSVATPESFLTLMQNWSD